MMQEAGVPGTNSSRRQGTDMFEPVRDLQVVESTSSGTEGAKIMDSSVLG